MVYARIVLQFYNCFSSSHAMLDHRGHTEWQRPLSCIMKVKSAQITLSTITSKVVVYAASKRADTLPIFLFYLYMYFVVRLTRQYVQQ